MQRRLWQLLAVLLAFTLVAAACGDDDESSDSGSGGTSDVTAAFVYIGEPGDAGWTYAHDNGRQFAEEQTGATTLTVENIPEGSPEFDTAVRDFID